MAHADYECCAICDCKMHYNPYAESKRMICSSCLRALRIAGVDVTGIGDLIGWMKNHPAEEVLKTLRNIGFRECYYENPIDETYALIKQKYEEV